MMFHKSALAKVVGQSRTSCYKSLSQNNLYYRRSTTLPGARRVGGAAGFHSSTAWQAKRWWGTRWIMDGKTTEDVKNTKLLALGPTWLRVDKEGSCTWGAGDETNGWVPKNLDDKLRGRQATLPHPNVIAMGPPGSDQYFVQFEDGAMNWQNLDNFLEKELRRMFGEPTQTNRHQVKSLALGPDNSYYCVWNNGRCCWNNLPETLQDHLHSNEKQSVLPVQYVSLGPNGEWFVGYYYGKWNANNHSDSCKERSKKIHDDGLSIEKIVFGANNSWVIMYEDGK